MEDLKIFIIAGEVSGDILASEIIKNLRIFSKKNIVVKGIAGKHLTKQGVKSIFPQDDISVMGFIEVIPAIPRIINRINYTVNNILSFNPDVIITIDSPDFNFRVIKKLKNHISANPLKSKFVHVVAPTVWAYREKRAEKISKLYDLLLVLLPFEPPYFTKYGLNTKFIGHPILYKELSTEQHDVIRKYNIDPQLNIITITLGSRDKEISQLAPIYKEALKKLYNHHKNLIIIIPTFDKYVEFFKNWTLDFSFRSIIITDEVEKLEFFKKSNFVIAKSGTNIIEIAQQETAFMACYKVNLLTYILLKMMVRTKYVNLLNIFAKEEIIPEYIQYKCRANNIYNQSVQYLDNKSIVKKQIKKQNKYIKEFLNDHNTRPAQMAAKEILSLVLDN